jgi:hypothetical protein
MSTQQEAQERAENYLETDDYCNEDKPKDIARDAFLAGEASGERITLERLAAKIAELEKYINDKASNGYVCECMTDCGCYETRLVTLEAQNKKLSDVVLEMADVLRLIEMRREGFEEDLVECPKLASEELEGHADLIKQLKQERMDTIRNEQAFGFLPYDNARTRERRALAVMINAKESIQSLESEKAQIVEVVREFVEVTKYYSFIENYQYQRYVDPFLNREKYERAVVGVDGCGKKAREALTKHKELLTRYGVNN